MSTTATTETFTVTVTGQYVCEEIPYRCRKPRPVAHAAKTTVQVPVVDSEQAPAAFRIHDVNGTETIRLYDQNLHALHTWSRDRKPVEPGSEHFPAEVEADRNHNFWISAESAEDFEAQARNALGGFVIIDGQVWKRTGEPRYYITTFGFGRNHGGTSLMTVCRDTYGRNTSIFRADDIDGARAYARRIANGRGDTDSLPRLDREPEIEVLIPEAVTLETIAAEPEEIDSARIDYSMAISRLSDYHGTAEEEAQHFEALVAARQRITDAGYEPVAPARRPEEVPSRRPRH